MRILIIEDELPAFNRLAKLIKEELPDAEILGPIDSIVEATQWFQSNAVPDVLFSDIQLADGNSFEFINQVRPQCPIIFTTAYDQFALDAFRTNSVDYLLKPIKKAELSNALGKLQNLKKILNQNTRSDSQSIFKSRFSVRIGDHIKTIAVEEIAYFYSENKFTFLKTFDEKTYPIDINLESLESQLNPNEFYRINRQYLANLKSIASVKSHSKGRVIVKFCPESKEDAVVSSEKSASFKKWLDGIIE